LYEIVVAVICKKTLTYEKLIIFLPLKNWKELESYFLKKKFLKAAA